MNEFGNEKDGLIMKIKKILELIILLIMNDNKRPFIDVVEN